MRGWWSTRVVVKGGRVGHSGLFKGETVEYKSELVKRFSMCDYLTKNMFKLLIYLVLQID